MERETEERQKDQFCSLQLRILRLGFLQDGESRSLSERHHESRKLQIKGVNFLRAHVAQHKRGIIRG